MQGEWNCTIETECSPMLHHPEACAKFDVELHVRLPVITDVFL